MSKYSGLSFPRIFSSAKRTQVVSDIDKIKSDIYLLLNQQVGSLLMNPTLGIDVEALLFADDVIVTRDFLYTFVMNSIIHRVPDIDLTNVTVRHNDGTLLVGLHFSYKRGTSEFDINYSLGGSVK